jgi:hypothetical protein
MTRAIGQLVLLTACLVAGTAAVPGTAQGDDLFFNAALTPSFMRDAHMVSAGGDKTGSASTSDGQHTGNSFSQFGVASDLWYDEHDQVLGGVYYGSREFDGQLVLPDGFTLPKRIDEASVSLLYKHITGNDWSISHSVRYKRTGINSLSGSGTDSIDLVGLAGVSHEPGYGWAYGYIWNQTGNRKFQAPIPFIEYINDADERYQLILGFPLLSAAYHPHPDVALSLDWTMGGMPGVSASYKVTELNHVSLYYGGSGWSYRLAGPVEKDVTYSARRLGLNWTSVYLFDRRTAVFFNASIGWEHGRKFGSINDSTNKRENTLAIGSAPVMGFNAGLSF